MALDKFTWENGSQVEPAKVEVEGVSYDVVDAQYEGSTPVSAGNLNAMQDTLLSNVKDDLEDESKIASCKAVKDVYSSTETKTNKVWDGKPVYRKSIEFSNIAKGTATTIETLSNVDKFFVNSNMSYCTDGTGTYTIPKTHISNVNNQLDVRYNISTGVVALGCGSGNDARSGILTVEYTKSS